MRVTTHAEPVNQAMTVSVFIPLLGNHLTLKSDCTSRPVDRRWLVTGATPGEQLVAHVAGTQLFAAADEHGSAALDWSGLDVHGRPVDTAIATATVAGTERRMRLGRWDARAVGLGGFLLGGYDYLDVVGQRIRTGHGRLRGKVALRTIPTGYAVDRDHGRHWCHFDSDGFLTAMVDAAGATVATWQRDGYGLTAHRGPDQDIRVHRESLSVVLDRRGFRTELQLDTQGRVHLVRDPAGNQLAIEWDERGLLAGLTEPTGFAHRFEHDEHGRLVTVHSPGNGPARLLRTDTEHGHRVTVLTSELRESTYSVERLPDGTRVRTEKCCGSQPTVTRMAGARMEVTRGDGTRIVSDSATGLRDVVLPSGLTSSRAKQGDTTAINGNSWHSATAAEESVSVTPEGRTSRVVQEGRLTHVERAGSRVTIRRDETGRVAEVHSGPQSTRLHYDAAGQVSQVAYGDGSGITLEHDATGWLTAQHFSDGRALRLDRGPDGAVLALAPPGRPAAARIFDAPARISQVRFAGEPGDAIVHRHDRDGLLISAQAGDGPALEYRRDSNGLVAEVVCGDTLARIDHHHGRPVRVQTGDGSQNTELGWDGHLLTRVTNSGVVSGTVTRSYDADFLVSALSCGDLSVPVSRDRDGLIVGLGPARFTRDAAGEVASIEAGVVAQRWHRDELGRVSAMVLEVAGTPVWQVQYRRDVRNRIVAMWDSHWDGFQPTPAWVDYGYDAAGRLVSAAGPWPFRATWDANGNLTTVHSAEVAGEATHDAADRMTSLGGLRMAYDGAGRVAMLYGEADGAVGVSAADHEYGYDGRGLLTSVIVRGADGARRQTRLVRDGMGNLISMQSDGAAPRHLLPGPDGYPDAVVGPDGAPETLFAGIAAAATPDIAVQRDRVLLIASDHVGSVRFVVDVASGAVVERRAYSPWGTLVHRDGDARIPFGWGGGLSDEATGLVHFPARSYSPRMLRFLSRDPLLYQAGSTNLYAFVGGDPINHRDPLGLQQVQICRKSTWMFVNDAEHWWIKQGNVEVGMGADPRPGRWWELIPKGAEMDHGNRSKQDGVTCDDVVNVDEECVAQGLRAGWEWKAPTLGTYVPGNTCQQWVNDVLNKCSGGEYVVKTDSPVDYERWYHPEGIKTEFEAKAVDGENYTADPSIQPPPGPDHTMLPYEYWAHPVAQYPIPGSLWR